MSTYTVKLMYNIQCVLFCLQDDQLD